MYKLQEATRESIGAEGPRSEIAAAVKKAGFAVPSGSVSWTDLTWDDVWMEENDSTSAYLHFTLGTESVPASEFASRIDRLEKALKAMSRPAGLSIVCHNPGDFTFRVFYLK